jgi:mitochondrial chaperone BCS1
MTPIDDLTKMLGSSPLIGSGFVLMVMSGFLSPLKAFPGEVFAWIKDRIITSITVASNTTIYVPIMYWITEQVLKGKPKNFRLKTRHTTDYSSPTEQVDMELTSSVLYQTGEGFHLGWFRKKPLMIHISKEKDSNDRHTGKFELHVSFVGSKSKTVKNIIAAAINYYKENYPSCVDAYFARSDYWEKGNGAQLKTLHSLALKGSIAQTVMDDIQSFVNAKAEYATYGMTFKRSYLLSGEPGTGKTSLIQAAATKFSMNIYYLDLRSIITGAQLSDLINLIPNGSIILLEDIDCVCINREDDDRKEEKGISLSTLLNVLDGLQTREGCIYFLTTNYKDRLDPALIRPGRVDLQVELGPANSEQIRELYLKFFPDVQEDIIASYIQTCLEEKQVIAKVHQYLIDKKFHKIGDLNGTDTWNKSSNRNDRSNSGTSD